MKSNSLIAMSLVAVIAGGSFFVLPANVFASHSLDLEQRRADREAAREARRAEREAQREARVAEREARRAARNSPEPSCKCSARLKFSSPDLSWRSGQLVLVPRVDIDIRTRGNVVEDPAFKANLTYSGVASYTSSDVTVASNPLAFSGQQEIVSGMCGDNRYSFKGYALSPVTLSGLTSNLLSVNQKLEGNVKMNAKITGCGLEEEVRAFQFTMGGLSNLDVGRLRIAR